MDNNMDKNFTEETPSRGEMCKTAFDWAVKELERGSFKLGRMHLSFDPGYTLPPPEECVVSAFVDNNGRCLVREDWMNEDPAFVKVSYHEVTNWSQVQASHPTLADDMLRNGVDLYVYYEGGPTRKMNKEWAA